MAKKLQYRRLFVMAVLLAAAFAGLGYRLVDLQVLRHEELSGKAQRNTQYETLLEPRRGDILDVRGNLLATSVFVKTVCGDPSLIGNHQAEVAHAIAPILQMSESQLTQRLTPQIKLNAKGESVTNQYIVLKKKVPVETWQKVHAAMANLNFGLDEKKLTRSEKGFYAALRSKAVVVDPMDDQLRVYPNQTLAAHVLGYVGTQDPEVNATKVSATAGKEGIELSLDSKLRGLRGWRLTERDGHQH
jgi:cell division protein FtsI/penicillin-binding protein 2